jgi:predicted nucleic acid-binding protein
MTARPRFLLDTEGLLHAVRSDGPSRELLQAGMLRDLALCTSTTILDELDDVLARPRFGIAAQDRSRIRQMVLAAADEIAIFSEAEAGSYVPGDPGDDHVVEAALRTGADAVVSQDRELQRAPLPGLGVISAEVACQRLRDGRPYGTLTLMTAAQEQEQREQLSKLAGPGRRERLGADTVFRELTEDLLYEQVDEAILAAVLDPTATARLAEEVVRRCGSGMALDTRPGSSFDYVAGTRHDAPGRGGLIPMDVIWYSSDRAQLEAITDPDLPTSADYGFLDEHRHRFVLAGGIVVVLGGPGPDGEPDNRWLCLVDEPLASLPPSSTRLRTLTELERQNTVMVRSLDPAGFSTSLKVWLAGGPSGLLLPSAPPPYAIDVAFRICDAIAHAHQLPTPGRLDRN